MIVQRVEKHIIKSNNQFFSMLDDFCFKSKNLYNHANFIVRNEFVKNNKWVRYCDLDKILRNDEEFPDYKNMPTAQCSQQILKLLDKNWKSFFASIKDWKKNPSKYLGRPKLPKYKAKDGRFILILTNQNVKLKDKILHFPKSFNGFFLKPKFVEKSNFKTFQQIRIIPNQKQFMIEIVYNIEISEKKSDNKKYLSIDIGLDNLATVTNNFGEQPFIVNGKGLKSVNKYYNKILSHFREIAKRMNKSDCTARMNRLTQKRNARISDFLHKSSKFIVDFAVQNDVNTIVIGNNKNWKQNSELSKIVNQSFVGIPHQKLIDMILYKAENVGINVIVTEESYTSGTSFLDNEEPTKENYNKSRRIHRGLFISNEGKRINADVNGSFQILKKVFPKAYCNGIAGVGLTPFRVSNFN